MELLDNFVDILKIKPYSYNTINAYKNILSKFFAFYKNSDPEELSKSDIEYFINY